jgi:hypothetical protein
MRWRAAKAQLGNAETRRDWPVARGRRKSKTGRSRGSLWSGTRDPVLPKFQPSNTIIHDNEIMPQEGLRGASQKLHPGGFHGRDAREAFWPHHTRRSKESPILPVARTAAWAGGDARSE